MSPGQLPSGTRRRSPCVFIHIGPVDELVHLPVLPALFGLACEDRLDPTFAFVSVDTVSLDSNGLRSHLRASVEAQLGDAAIRRRWDAFAERLHYLRGDLDAPETYSGLASTLHAMHSTTPDRLIYLALSGDSIPDVVRRLSAAGIVLGTPGRRDEHASMLLVESALGEDLASARARLTAVGQVVDEHQIVRITSDVGKEPARQVIRLRFPHGTLESIWNRDFIHHVQITVAEDAGASVLGKHHRSAGVVRDRFSHHLLQLLAHTAMEPPRDHDADGVRAARASILQGLRVIEPTQMHDFTVRGQYGPGHLRGRRVPGFREDGGVSPTSDTPTYAAIRLLLDTPRWQGVPFFLRSGRRMTRTTTEVAIQFRTSQSVHLPGVDGVSIQDGVRFLCIGRDATVTLLRDTDGRQPPAVLGRYQLPADVGGDGYPTWNRVPLGLAAHAAGAEAFAGQLIDLIEGDVSLFPSHDEEEAAWRVLDPILRYWDATPTRHFPNYPAGSWGPGIAERFAARSGVVWRKPS